MNYRKAGLQDVEKLSELFDQYRMFYRKESDLEGARNFLKERITKGESEIFVAYNADEEFTGFVQLYPLFSSTRMKKFWLLNDLFVHPDYRGQGIGEGLINQAKELVKNTKACAMFLETEKSNVIGNQLYPKTGFVLNDGSNYYEWNVEG